MSALPSLLRAFTVLAVLAPSLAASATEEDLAQVGTIKKVENEAAIVVASAARPAVVGMVVHLKDELRTGAEGRMLVVFRDDTELTLGEKASVVIDRYVYDPDKGIGETLLQTTRGAFRFATGRMVELKEKTVVISTSFADIAVRGTEFWGGPIDAKYGVLLLEGEIIVANQAGRVTLSKTVEGTNIATPLDPPSEPTIWPESKVSRAIETVTLH
ncbi:MAG TPA: FecR family protein [Methyloceanibacter sp.]|nr:FecR family protein [Methyloceanibacter sp.]